MKKQTIFSGIAISAMLVIALVLVLLSCSRKDETIQQPVNSGILKTTVSTITPSTYDIYGGADHIIVGSVALTEVDPATHDGNNLEIAINLTGDNKTNEIHWWIGTEEFGWQSYSDCNGLEGHLPGQISLTDLCSSYTFDVNVSGFCNSLQYIIIFIKIYEPPDYTSTRTGSLPGTVICQWKMEASFTTSVPLAIENPPAQCGGTVDLTAPAITAGSADGLAFTYWEDALATIPLTNYTAVGVSGTYYIQAVSPSGCLSAILPVVVTINPLPDFTVTDPPQFPSPPPNIVYDLHNAISNISPPEPEVTFTYYADANLTNQLSSSTVTISAPGSTTFWIKATTSAGCILVKFVTLSAGTIITDDICDAWQVETAFGGNIQGGGPAWWFIYDNRTGAGGYQPIKAGQIYDAGTVIYTGTTSGGTITINLANDWELYGVNTPYPVKIQGYNTIPNKRPPAGQFTTYKGNSLSVTVPYFKYYDIQLDLRKCTHWSE